MQIEDLGWNSRFEEWFAPHVERGLVPARVVRVDRERCRLAGAAGCFGATVAGRLRHEAAAAAELPAVGDWVAVALRPGEDQGTVQAVLPRATCFSRRAAGRETAEQVIAANVDIAFVVCGLDGDFNLRRIERFLGAVWESGARPVVVLNKADLPGDTDAPRAAVEAIAFGTPVLALSALTGAGVPALSPHLARGRTAVLVGSSGAGKSTLANALLGEARLATAPVRADDSRGRHATTWRELIALPGGALLIDGPGVREIGLWSEEESPGAAFADLEAAAVRCHFRDCGHAGEPGCAVLAEIPEERLAAWRKLQRELRATAAKWDQRLRLEEKRRWKIIHRSARQLPDKRNPRA